MGSHGDHDEPIRRHGHKVVALRIPYLSRIRIVLRIPSVGGEPSQLERDAGEFVALRGTWFGLTDVEHFIFK